MVGGDVVGKRQRQCVAVMVEMEAQAVNGWCAAVFDRERELLACLPARQAFSAQVEVGVAPSMEFAGAAQCLAWADVVVSILSGMVDEDDCKREATLQLAQERENWGDIACLIFIAGMEADEGVERQECWAQSRYGVLKSCAVGRPIQRQARLGDEVERESFDPDSGGGADSVEARAHIAEGILSGKEEHGAGSIALETSKARRAGCDTDGQIQRQEAFKTLGFSSDDADGLISPEVLDQPARGLGACRYPIRAFDCQALHGFNAPGVRGRLP